MEHAIDSVGKLLDCGKYEVYIASTAPWGNIDSLSHKRIWIEKYFDAGNSTTMAMVQTIEELGQVRVEQNMPNVGGSLREIKRLMLSFHEASPRRASAVDESVMEAESVQ